jgi:hypothetical protein
MRFTIALALYLWAALSSHGANPALDEVNAYRAKKGLRPFVEDPGLTQAAMATADYRAARHMFGHTTGGAGDFRFLPHGVRADSAGCAAYPPRYGWMSCDADDNYQYAGAAWTMGDDGKRYMHLFVRGKIGSSSTPARSSGFYAAAPRRIFRR